jgi:very-short-patch-repair endonuclease
LETVHGRPLKAFLQDIYVEQRLTTDEIHQLYGITYRALRDFLEMCDMPLRSRSDAVTLAWERDDGSRSRQASETMKETMNNIDLTGDNNPARRPAVARKIAAAKRRHNPGLLPMLESLRTTRLANPTDIEERMSHALKRAGIHYVREFRVGLFFIDFAIPDFKIGIECDGSRWHDLHPERDSRRDASLMRWGWSIYRFDGDAIRDDADRCVEDLIANLDALGIDPTTTQ